ncbi:MAG: PAS domain S-box protein [Balneola sp.]|nr:MAG: PAS domain S-box protein [Balneola sp.]
MSQKEDTFFGTQCMFVCDQISLEILDVNENTVQRLGLGKEEILGKKLFELGSEVSSLYHKSFMNKSLSNKIWEFDINGSGSQLVQFSSHLINYQGRPCKLVVAHDISQTPFNVPKESQLSSPVEFIDFPMGEIEWDSSHKILRWSPKAEEIFGWSQEEAMRHPSLLKSFVHPEDLVIIRKEFAQTIKEKIKSKSIVNRNITKSGKVIYCEWYNSYLFDDDGNLVSIYSLVIDITDRIKALNKVQRSMQSFRDLFDSISDAIYLINDEGVIVGANKGTELTYGYKVNELIGENHKILGAVGKFDPARLAEISKNKGDKGSQKLDGWGKKINGEVFPTELLVSKGIYFEQEVLIIIERDISDRRLAEEELKKREHLLNDLFNTSPLGIALLNKHNEIIEVNKGFEELFGYSGTEIEGLELDRLIVPEQDIVEAKKLSNTPRVEDLVTRRKSKEGELIDVIIYAVPIIIDEKMMYKYGIYVDISDRKKTEEQLRSSLKEKEVLLAEIHHRVKNNLAVIMGLLELQSYSVNNEDAKTILQESQMRIQSIALVHEKLYDTDDFSEIKVENYIKELAQTVQQTIGNQSVPVHIQFDMDEIYLPITQAIPCGLILNEVLTNSYKHAFIGKDEGCIQVVFKKEADHLLFIIRDDGIGFDIESSKRSRSLGMKLIKTLADQLSGTLEVSTKEGAEFAFRFKKEE